MLIVFIFYYFLLSLVYALKLKEYLIAIFFCDFLECFFFFGWYLIFIQIEIYIYIENMYINFDMLKIQDFTFFFAFCFVWHIWLLCVWLPGALLYISLSFIHIFNEINWFLLRTCNIFTSISLFSRNITALRRFLGAQFCFCFFGLQWVFAVLLCRPCHLFK